MRHTRLGLTCLLVIAAVVMTGCKDDNEATAATGPAPTTPSAAASAAATLDAATKQVCTTLAKDITSTTKKVAAAEKIGPPAGYAAVSAQYSAGAAAFYAHSIGANDEVNDAAEKAATAMSDLADKWGKNPKAKPSKTALSGAGRKLTAACSVS